MWGLWGLVCVVSLALPTPTLANEPEDTAGWQRVESRYCTLWVHPEIPLNRLNRQVSTWRVRPQMASAADTAEAQLAAKCDTLFRRAEELLDMYPPGIHVVIRVEREIQDIHNAHAAHYGFGTSAVAFYLLENNTVYAAAGSVTESVLAHEMAHCVVDHYFGVRPPRKIEEMLAMFVDEHLRD